MMAMAMGNCGMEDPGMPDLSHLSEEERAIIQQVLQRQKAEEQKEEEILQKGDKELDDIEKQINERKENAQRLVGTQDDAICQICQKTKFADGIGHKCFYCQLRSCARCGGKTTSKNKNIWACSLCQKRQQILARTGKWFQNPTSEPTAANANDSPTPSQSSHGMAQTTSQQHLLQNQQEQDYLEQPSTHQRSASDASSTARRPSETTVAARKMSVKQQHRQSTLLHRQPSLEADSQAQGINGSSGAAFVNGGDGVTMAINQNGGGPVNYDGTKQQQIRKTSRPQQGATHQGSSAERTRVATQGVGQQEQQPQRGQSKHASNPSASTASHHQAPTSDGRKTSDDPRQAHAHHNQRSPLVTKKSFDDRQPANQASPRGDPRKARPTDSRQRTATEQRGVRQSAANQAFVPSPLAVPPPDKPSTSTTASIVNANLPKGSPLPSRARRSKMSRQMRSLSSSEEEHQHQSSQHAHGSSSSQVLPSSTSLHNSLQQSQLLQDQDFSEKGPSQFTDSLESGRATGISAGSNILATKIRNYLSHDNVSWQPSADQRRLIGHMILIKPPEQANASTDFGLKVIGGRHSATGRLGTFVTKVKPGSVADSVGQLRPGDEVLEWNGNCLQNITHDAVYKVINATKNDTKLELIVSRSVNYPNDDFLNIHRIAAASHTRPTSESGFYDSRGFIDPSTGMNISSAIPIGGGTFSPYDNVVNMSGRIPHSLSLVAGPLYNKMTAAEFHQGRAASPLVFHRTPNNYVEASPLAAMQSSNISSVHICGRIEISLLYLIHKRELVVTLHRAYDLVPRQDGTARNPYVKFFLLPDRSEKSRRQSAALAETLVPVWNESFYYFDLTEPLLMSRVLEVTVWDYDKYEANSFLGETLIDLSQTPLENQPFAYSLLDMDDENPLRLRLRQRRYSSQTPPVRSRSQTSHYNSSNYARHGQGYEGDDYFDCSYSMQNLPYHHDYNSRRSRPPERSQYPHPAGFVDSTDWNKNSTSGSGYLSDHGQAQQYGQLNSRPHHRRPRSATALRNVAEIEDSDQSNYGGQQQQASYLQAYEGDQSNYDARQQRKGVVPGNEFSGAQGSSTNGKHKGRTRQEIIQVLEQSMTGYGSDGGSETLSVNSAQSMQNRALNRPNQDQQNPSSISVEDNDMGSGGSVRGQGHHHHTTSTEDYGLDNMEDNNFGSVPGMGGERPMIPGGNGALSSSKGGQAAVLLAKQRKKSLMTRFIPGRNGSSENNKRMGFARSEEVGVHEALSVPGEQLQPTNTFTKQASKESTDSDNFLPILPDRPLGSFVENLGPGQVVGRQVLASPVMGEILVKLYIDPAMGIVVEVLEAKNLVVRQGTKAAPAPYVKAYLIEGKNCLAKAKTQTSRKSTTSLIQQTMVFNVFDPKKKMLQLSVLGDYGRMERKGFLGIAQINLEELDLSQHIVGWYKLFHSNSLVTGSTQQGGPVRKDSDMSLNEMRQ